MFWSFKLLGIHVVKTTAQNLDNLENLETQCLSRFSRFWVVVFTTWVPSSLKLQNKTWKTWKTC